MGYAQIHTCTVLGLKAPAVTVEVHLANGLPNFALVGLADTEVREARERVRSAILNSGLEFPSNKRIIVNLAPAVSICLSPWAFWRPACSWMDKRCSSMCSRVNCPCRVN